MAPMITKDVFEPSYNALKSGSKTVITIAPT